MSEETPLVSVVLPVYNGEKYIASSIQSILNQSFRDFELIVLNDGSKDQSSAVIEAIKDPRLKLINQDNIGLAATLNKGISLARGKYIARQDHDDLSDPSRFEKQLRLLEENPDMVVVGTGAQIIELETLSSRTLLHPQRPSDLKAFLCFDNPFVHTSLMYRKKEILECGGYSSDKNAQPEDYDLLSKVSRRYNLTNLSEVLVQYREVPTAMTKSKPIPFPMIDQITARHLAYYFPFLPKAWLQEFGSFIHFNKIPGDKIRFFLRAILIYKLIVIRFLPLEKPTWKKILGSFKRLVIQTFSKN